MKTIPVSSSATFLGVNAAIAAAAIAGVAALVERFGLDWSGLSLFLTGFAFFYAGNMLFLKLLLRLFPIPEGVVAPGTRTDYVVGVYLLFFIFYIAPVSFSRLMPAPFTSLWYRFLGARIGKGSFPSGAVLADSHFVELGQDVTLGFNCVLTPHIAAGNGYSYGRIVIGDRVTVGVNTVVYGGVEIGDGALILANSAVVPGTRIGENELWGGNPAKKVKVLKPGDRAWNGAPQAEPQAWNGEKGLEIARGV